MSNINLHHNLEVALQIVHEQMHVQPISHNAVIISLIDTLSED